MIVTVSDINGIKQYSVPGNIKAIFINIFLVFVALLVGFLFYIKKLHYQVVSLEQANEMHILVSDNSNTIEEKFHKLKLELERVKSENVKQKEFYESKISKILEEQKNIKDKTSITAEKLAEEKKKLQVIQEKNIALQNSIKKEEQLKQVIPAKVKKITRPVVTKIKTQQEEKLKIVSPVVTQRVKNTHTIEEKRLSQQVDVINKDTQEEKLKIVSPVVTQRVKSTHTIEEKRLAMQKEKIQKINQSVITKIDRQGERLKIISPVTLKTIKSTHTIEEKRLSQQVGVINKDTQEEKLKIVSPVVSKRVKGTHTIEEKRLSFIVKQSVGKSYIVGASGPNVFDDIGLVSYVYREIGIKVPKKLEEQAQYGALVQRDELKIGDLLFFDMSKNSLGVVNHVGIYVGNHKFIHASETKKRVVTTSLNKAFYSKRYKWARRIIN